ncbi:hypothetical protein EDF56_106316 [Novosphingobium sp. PhB165]|uniref:hypothetical protein n=1 Tax=Novosphingobium sp. PhB165 TaxID=2485105 RepID=UPI001042DFAB|nr:hypothetical protein [Novosphingobium sp. PhB165]TCM17200.1 hypothetical protein EDF56_106316 [Novosphingobium sp. PhB165]
MAKALKTAALVVGAVALVATGVGALAGAGVLGAAAMGTTGVVAGISVGTITTIGAFAGLAAAALSFAAAKMAPGISAQGDPTKFTTNPQSGLPYAMGRTRMSGLRIFAATSERPGYTKFNDLLWFGALLSIGGQIGGIEQFTADNEAITFSATTGNAVGTYYDYMAQKVHLGDSPQASALALSLGGGTAPGWTSAHKLSGITHAMWCLRYNKEGDMFGAGAPEPAWIGKWVKVYDPRKDSTYPGGSGSHRALNESTYEWSDNPGLHALTWALGRWENGKRTCGIGAPVSTIRVVEFVECANICDANAWKMGGVEWTTDSKWDTLKRILQAGGAMPTQTGAMIGCRVNTPRTAIATIESRHLLDGLSLAMTKSRRDRFNTVIPRYVDEASDWSVISGTAITVDEYVTADKGQRTKEIDYPLVQVFSGDQAKQPGQLAAYDIVNSREAGPFTFTTGPEWIGLKTGDVVYLDVPEEGLDNQPVLITKRAIDPSTGKVSFAAVTETYSKHAFALGQSTTPPSPFSLSAAALKPPAPAETEWAVTGTTSGEGFPALMVSGVSQMPSADAVVIDYRLHNADAWTNSAILSTVDPVLHVISPLESETRYDVRIGYRVGTITGDFTIFSNVATGTGKITTIESKVDDLSVTAKVTAYLTVPAVNLFAYANGNVIDYSTATGQFRVMRGTTDVSSQFTIELVDNPNVLTATLSGNTYSVTGGLVEDTATLAMRATGSDDYAGLIFDQVFTLSRVKAGYEIVSDLPTTDNFEGRAVYFGGKLYTFTDGAWKTGVDGADISGEIATAQLAADFVSTVHTSADNINELIETYGSTASAADSAAAADASKTAASNYATAAGAAKDASQAAQTLADASKAAAATSATAAATAKTGADTAATNAATAKTQAETAAANAKTSETNAASSAGAASTSAGQASTSATNAGTSASQASGYATTASTAATNAGNSATAASTAATTATTKASDAATSATTASTAATTASTKAGDAQTYANNAASSATSASGSATTATTQAGVATTQAGNAGSSASAAAASAATATTKASDASTSATTATNQATIATTKAGDASTYANNAATSATGAAGSATTATTQAGVAATQASYAQNYAQQNLLSKGTFDDNSVGQWLNATVTADAGPTGMGHTKVLLQGNGNDVRDGAYRSGNWSSRKIRCRGWVKNPNGAANVGVGILGTSSTDGSSLNTKLTITTTTGWTPFDVTISTPGNFATAAPFVRSDTPYGVMWSDLIWTDITESYAADASATAAATSASTASTKATDAGNSATAAAASATTATTQAGNAQTYANNASTSATGAAGSATTATTQAGVAASSAAAASKSAATTIPSTFENSGEFFDFEGLPASGVTWSTTDGGATVSTGASTNYALLRTKNGLPIIPGHRYRATAKVRNGTADATHRPFVRLAGFDSSNARTAYTSVYSSGGTTWQTIVAEIDASAVAGTIVTIKAEVALGYPAGVANNSQCCQLLLEDITAAYNANASANAAATSATTASTQSTAAGASATAASASALTASTQAAAAQQMTSGNLIGQPVLTSNSVGLWSSASVVAGDSPPSPARSYVLSNTSFNMYYGTEYAGSFNGRTFKVSGWVKVPSTSGSGGIGFGFFGTKNTGGTITNPSSYVTVGAWVADTWSFVTGVLTVPAGTFDTARPFVRSNSPFGVLWTDLVIEDITDAVNAGNVVAGTFPERMTIADDAYNFVNAVTAQAAPAAVARIDPAQVVAAAGYGLVYQGLPISASLTYVDFGPRALLPATPGKIYKVEAEAQCTVFASGDVPQLSLQIRKFDGSYASNAGVTYANQTVADTATVYKLTGYFSDVAIAAANGQPAVVAWGNDSTGAAPVWLRPYLRHQRASGSVVGSQVQFRRITITDVTSSYAAATNASVATTQAASATASAASATTSATVAATVAVGGLNTNPSFNDWPTSGLPTGWANWAGTAPTKQATGRNSAYYAQFVATAANTGLQQIYPAGTGLAKISEGYYVIEADVELVSGDFSAAGVLFRGNDASNAVTDDLTMKFSDFVPSPVVGKVYPIRKMVRITNTATVKASLFLMANWSSMGTLTAKTINVYRCSVRPASDAEISTGQIATLSASVTTQAGAITTLQGKTSAYWQTVAGAGTSTAVIAAKTDGTTAIVSLAGSKIQLANTDGSAYYDALVIENGNATLAGKLRAGAVQAQNMAVTNKGLNLDPTFLGGATMWAGWLSRSPASTANAWPCTYGASFGARDNVWNGRITCKAGEQYKISGWTWIDTGNTPTGGVGFCFYWYDVTGAVITGQVAANNTVAGWKYQTATVTVPAGATSFTYGFWVDRGKSDGTQNVVGSTFCGDMELEKLADASLIVDGTITTQKLLVGTTGSNLVTNGKALEGVGGWVTDEGSNNGQLVGGFGWGDAGRSGFWYTKPTTAATVSALNKAFPVVPGRTYSVRATVGGSAVTTNGLYMRMCYTATQPADGYVRVSSRAGFTELVAGNGPIVAGFTDYAMTWTCPAGMYWASFAIYNWANGPVQLFFSDVEITEQTGGTKIANGVITTDKLAVGAVTAANIAVTSLDAIAANVGTLTAGTIKNAGGTYSMDITNGRTVVQSGGYMKVTGAPFGSSNQFIEWYGPYQSNLSACNEANAVQYLRTDGQAYFGGAITTGSFRNSITGTTNMDPSSETILGPFSTNGGTKTVAVSAVFNMSRSFSSGPTMTTTTTPTFRVTLYRSRDGTNWTQLAQNTYNGSYSFTPAAGGDPGSLSMNIAGNFTFTDNGATGTTACYYRVLIDNRAFPTYTGTGNGAGSNTQRATIISTEG